MPFVKLSEAEVEVMLFHLPKDSINDTCQDLRLRLSTLLPVFPGLPEDFVIGGPEEPEEPEPEPDEKPKTKKRVTKKAPADPPWPKGVVPFGTLPFGWRRHGEKVVVAKEEQDVMKWILKGKKKEWTHEQIANDLNGRMLKTRRGSKWEGSGVSRLLKTSIEHKMNKALKKRWG